MRRLYIFQCLMLLPFAFVYAQDNHFTLYNNLPLSLNPGMTVSMVGETRAGALYRNQWNTVGKPFTTISAYADKKLAFKKFEIGVGLSILNDRSGPGRLNVVEIFPSASIGLRFRNQTFMIGLQPGIVHKKIQESTFPNQFDPVSGSYTTSLPSGEKTDLYRKAYFDLNAGVIYMLRLKRGLIQIGQAVHHLNTPNESLMGNQEKLPLRYTTHADYLRWFKSGKTYITTSGYFMLHNKASEMVLNMYVGYKILSETNTPVMIRLGTAYRNNIKSATGSVFFQNSDAVSALAGMSWGEIHIDFAYDVNVSTLSETGRNAGAFEITLTYKNDFERKNNGVAVPCRRY